MENNPEYESAFVSIVLKYYNLEQYPIQSCINITSIRNKYYQSSTKARKNRRREIRDAIAHSYKNEAILKDLEGNVVKESDFKDTEDLINNCSLLFTYSPVHWWTIIKEYKLEKDFIWKNVKTGHGGWNWTETQIIHKPLNIYYQS